MGCITSANRQNNSLTFHFAGIRSPKSRKSTLNITDKVPIITINSSLTTEDTIKNLKKLIHKTYKISSDTDILILYSHTIISNDDELTLQDFGITNNSLLFLAIKTENDIDISSLSLLTTSPSLENILVNSPRLRFQIPQINPPPQLIQIPNTITLRNLLDNPPRRRHIRSRIHWRNDDFKIENSIESLTTDTDTDSSDDIYEADTNLLRLNIRPLNLNINIDNTIPHTPLPPQLPTLTFSTEPPSSPQPTGALTIPNYSNILSPIQRNRPPIINNIPDIMITSPSPPSSPPLQSLPRPIRRSTTFHFRDQSDSPIPEIFQHTLRLHTEIMNDEKELQIEHTNRISLRPITPIENVNSNSNNLSPTNSITGSNDLIANTRMDTLSLKPIKGFDIITQEKKVLGYNMPHCGHFMNKDSLREYALSVFSDRNNIVLKCPHSLDGKEQKYDEWSCTACTFLNSIDRSNCEMCATIKPYKKICDMKWDWCLIKKVLMTHKEKGVVSIEIEENCINKLTKLELLSARNKLEKECNIQKCPQCESVYYREDNYNQLFGQKFNVNNLEKVLKIKCEMCIDVSFCWGCGVEWSEDHFCDSSFRNELIKILKEAEIKKIGQVEKVPSIRCCPNCCQLIYHSDACKHMKCKRCKTDFCFVCLKMKKNGNWQCGSHSDICDVAERQNIKTLPNSVIINKKAFQLF